LRDGVLVAEAEIDDRVVVADIMALAEHGVVAAAAIEHVVAGAAQQQVALVAAVERVVAGAAV